MIEFLIGRLRSFKFAFKGLAWVFTHEKNAQFHLLATVVVLGISYLLGLSTFEWLCIVIAIGIVLLSELLNTAIEKLADFVSQEQHPQIGIAKDVAAGAVLIATLTAVVIGLIIFTPKVLLLFSKIVLVN